MGSQGFSATMWTIWHIAYTHRFGKATLAPHFAKHLSVVHGSQESEHGNGKGRIPLHALQLGAADASAGCDSDAIHAQSAISLVQQQAALRISDVLLLNCTLLLACCADDKLAAYDYDLGEN